MARYGRSGMIEATQANLAFQMGGRIQDVLVEEGQTVDADQLLAVLEPGSALANRNQAAANLLYADASSGSDIKAQDLETQVCNANASSGADIRVYATETLTAHATSGADIHYSGDAQVETRKSASGSVHRY